MDDNLNIKPTQVTSQLTYTWCGEDGCGTCSGGGYTWALTGQVNGVTKDSCGDLTVNLQVTVLLDRHVFTLTGA